jgi:hypothetical protein
MVAEKKANKTKLPEPVKEEKREKSQDEYDLRRKVISEKMRSRRVNYVVKDLPIY